LTAALKPLERRGLVAVTTDPEDRRGRLMMLTSAGRRLLARATPIWEREHAEIEGLLPDGDPDHFRSHMRALSSHLGVGRSRNPRRAA
jgi:DNA-binding MarR family transcriptional regulator